MPFAPSVRRLRGVRTPPALPTAIRYAIAPGATVAAALAQAVLRPEIAPFAFFFCAVAVSSWLGGRGPGLLTVALSALAGNYAFVAPQLAWSTSGGALAATAVFVASASLVCLLCASLRGALLDAEKTAGERLRAETALRESDRRKDSFIAMLSHELRNPLAPARNALWLMDRAEPGSAQAAHAKEILERQLLHLTRIVDDLLDVTRISRGMIQLHNVHLDLGAVVHRSVEDNESLFSARDVTIAVELPTVPIWIDGDATRLAQAIGNLLWNAAKFTGSGGHVAVEVQRASDATAIVRIRDDGIGIPADVLDHLFEPFIQADTSLDRKKGGLGLGLSLVKGVVELHRGSVHATSEGPGRGAEFTIRLPLAPEQSTLQGSPRPAHEMPRHRVLVVEDNLDAAETLREMLLVSNQEVEVAHDGREGLEKAHAFRPDVVLCDIGLPSMDGYEVARAIRSDPTLASTFLVAVTGYASPEDERRAVRAGFNRHLGKPVPIDVIEDVLASAPRSQGAEA